MKNPTGQSLRRQQLCPAIGDREPESIKTIAEYQPAGKLRLYKSQANEFEGLTTRDRFFRLPSW